MATGDFLLKVAGQLVLSVVFASIVGFERELHGRPAGLRTHILVGVGATLFTIASTQVAGATGDAGRIAAQIVTGVGFLGAGTIIHHGSVVRGLTTAATLWAVAGVGLAVGLGGRMIYTALIATAVIWVTLTILRRIERYLEGWRDSRELFVTCTNAKRTLRQVVDLLDDLGVEVRSAGSTGGTPGGVGTLAMSLYRPGGMDIPELTGRLSEVEDIVAVEWR
jgi:putative Mg2+ transporter-C (MgtC) family protein